MFHHKPHLLHQHIKETSLLYGSCADTKMKTKGFFYNHENLDDPVVKYCPIEDCQFRFNFRGALEQALATVG